VPDALEEIVGLTHVPLPLHLPGILQHPEPRTKSGNRQEHPERGYPAYPYQP
jgi:hypothetical protein